MFGDLFDFLLDFFGLGGSPAPSQDTSVLERAPLPVGKMTVADKPSGGFGSFSAVKSGIVVTVYEPGARLWWTADKWKGTRLADLYERGEKVDFDRANDIMMKRMDCWEAPRGNSFGVTRPSKLYVVRVQSKQQAAQIQALCLQHELLLEAVREFLGDQNVREVDLSKTWKDKVTRTITLSPGLYLLVAELNDVVKRKWCCPTNWWQWEKTGPRLRSKNYMREHCTKYLTKFNRIAQVNLVGDYSVRVEVKKDELAVVKLKPEASIVIGDRSHFITSKSKAANVACELRDLLYDTIIKKIFGD